MGLWKRFIAACVFALLCVACATPAFPTPLPTATPFVFPSPLPTATPAPTATPIALPSPLPTATPQSIVFPTPLPTATPAPTATPIVLPSRLPTPTPQSVVYPTPLPTATPIALPTPLPTPTPQSLVYPTPLPTATPIAFPTPLPTPLGPGVRSQQGAFAGLAEAVANGVTPLFGSVDKYGSGFAVKLDKCDRATCLLTAGHVPWERTFPRSFRVQHPSLGTDESSWAEDWASEVSTEPGPDLAVVPTDSMGHLRVWELAPEGYDLKPGQPVRALVMDYRRNQQGDVVDWEPYVLAGVVAAVSGDENTFMFTGTIFSGNSGGVVLNEDMQVVGLIIDIYALRLSKWWYPSDRVDVPLPDRSRAVHFNAIRQQLREWDLLD